MLSDRKPTFKMRSHSQIHSHPTGELSAIILILSSLDLSLFVIWTEARVNSHA